MICGGLHARQTRQPCSLVLMFPAEGIASDAASHLLTQHVGCIGVFHGLQGQREEYNGKETATTFFAMSEATMVSLWVVVSHR